MDDFCRISEYWISENCPWANIGRKDGCLLGGARRRRRAFERHLPPPLQLQSRSGPRRDARNRLTRCAVSSASTLSGVVQSLRVTIQGVYPGWSICTKYFPVPHDARERRDGT